ncbi:hypothetical protein CMUS01_11736 [Colletotrichum musicola]|uniref:Uncharacterized protein n=1 Tax=Colletotrichum musicola TaxID=2175873 RepID=A0A8H6JU83_9PEZI|nr:hypothetical protein CMUS01_11736 [Colletotrichum musicola]
MNAPVDHHETIPASPTNVPGVPPRACHWRAACGPIFRSRQSGPALSVPETGRPEWAKTAADGAMLTRIARVRRQKSSSLSSSLSSSSYRSAETNRPASRPDFSVEAAMQFNAGVCLPQRTRGLHPRAAGLTRRWELPCARETAADPGSSALLFTKECVPSP